MATKLGTGDFIATLHDDEARQYFEKHWKGSQSSFCKQYRVDPSNFSKWRRGIKPSPSSLSAVRSFLLTLLADETTKRGLLETCNAQNAYVLTRRQTVLDKLLRRVEQLKAVIFIDGDNSSNIIHELLEISRTTSFDSIFCVACFASANSQATHDFAFLSRTLWISPLFSKTANKNATDHVMSMFVDFVHMSVRKDLDFYLVSTDDFVIEVGEQIRDECRRCYTVNSRSLPLDVLLMYNGCIPNILFKRHSLHSIQGDNLSRSVLLDPTNDNLFEKMRAFLAVTKGNIGEIEAVPTCFFRVQPHLKMKELLCEQPNDSKV
eukprot:GILK01009579.1.p1 GENE.GILK01009579.1~~GILK01009579.1.p1  ORF type:complete len:320 (+),score=22.68 GILK01009579.1:89-1048(+)